MTAAAVRPATLAGQLASWATALDPDAADLVLAERSLLDTVAVALAARAHPLRPIAALLPEAANWAAMGHVLDFDDLHMESTAHISVVCVAATLAAGGDARAYLAGAGVMARLGSALGWSHYARGWHATCTAGAPAAAVAACVAMGLDPEVTARAMALAVPAAGGVQRAFGTTAKPLQVGFAAAAGLRAARLAAAGAGADPAALDDWLALVGGTAAQVAAAGPAVPGGLAIKLYPCCYALQRPIAAMQGITADPGEVAGVVVRTPEGTVQPLIHHRPSTGLEGKFSLEYALAATLLDGYPGFASFEDAAVRRPSARELVETVEVITSPGGAGLLDGELEVEVRLRDGTVRAARLALPPGSPSQPPTPDQLQAKLAACGEDVPGLLEGLSWGAAAALLRRQLPSSAAAS
ncbi:MAG TPA: MmgE/PrpD family protein [Candidatus Dormibacteraeota bacterium]|nr:MmgE/PrpD family protein [Candidatus Dormibacteraeota bacterium]